jgi:hypothetical protein
MKVKELINALKRLDPEADLVASQSDGSICDVYTPYVIEEDITSGQGKEAFVLAKKGDVCINVNF